LPASEGALWPVKSERFGCTEVHDEQKFCGLLDGYLGWLPALENAVDVSGGYTTDI
jgi:hypothetical protein